MLPLADGRAFRERGPFLRHPRRRGSEPVIGAVRGVGRKDGLELLVLRRLLEAEEDEGEEQQDDDDRDGEGDADGLFVAQPEVVAHVLRVAEEGALVAPAVAAVDGDVGAVGVVAFLEVM